MNLLKLFSLIVLLPLFVNCGEDNTNVNDLFSINISEKKKSYTPNDNLNISLNNKKGKEIDQVVFTYDGKTISGSGNTASLNLANEKLGKRIIEATITSGDKEYKVQKSITVKSAAAGKVYGYKILETYPHDMDAFTQGLEFRGDTLYESTGRRGKSTLRKVDYKTGKVLESVKLEDAYFAEGLTLMNDKAYQLTWQSNVGFIYSLPSLEKTGTFVYNQSKEGWGLCNDGSKIYKSDGTQKIWILNPNTLAEEDYIEMYTSKSVIDNINELEYVEGKIYANIWKEDAIAIVNPKNGAVEGVINLKGLQKEVTQHSQLDVLNGIAYKGEPNILYVTGKNWDKLFKIEVTGK